MVRLGIKQRIIRGRVKWKIRDSLLEREKSAPGKKNKKCCFTRMVSAFGRRVTTQYPVLSVISFPQDTILQPCPGMNPNALESQIMSYMSQYYSNLYKFLRHKSANCVRPGSKVKNPASPYPFLRSAAEM